MTSTQAVPTPPRPVPAVRAPRPARPPLIAERFDPAAVIDEILAGRPYPDPDQPLPAEATSGACCRPWWDGLPWGAAESSVSYLCSLDPGHAQPCRQLARDGSVVSIHLFTDTPADDTGGDGGSGGGNVADTARDSTADAGDGSDVAADPDGGSETVV